MSQSVPATIGKYQIIREIARSNDIVYEAYDPQLNRRVAVKELNMSASATQQQRDERARRFEREVKAAGSLAHPNIVTIYEYGEDNGRVFMAMEYLDGRNLRNELDVNGVLPVDRALDIAKSVLEALWFAHENGIVHRDVKPENIQILESGRVKLTDFGIARITFEPNITMDGQVFGTPSYMSPEQVVGKEIDARSDLFSVGTVLYEMIAGTKAFPGDNIMAISYAIMNTEPEPPAQANYMVAELLRAALQKSAALRFSSAAEFLKRIDEVKAADSVVLPSGPQPLGQTVMGQPAPVYAQTGNMPPPPPVQPASPYAYNYAPPPQIPLPMHYGRVYSPRPPLPPLISLEAKRALVKLLLITGTLVLLFWVVYVSMDAMAKAAQKLPTAEMNFVPEPRRTQSPPNAANAQATRDSHELEARSLADRAVLQENPMSQIPIWEESANNWIKASQLEQDPERKADLLEGAARCYYNAAVAARISGERPLARSLLFKTGSYVRPGSETDRAIEELKAELGAN